MAVVVLLLALAFGASPFLVPDFGGFDPQAFPIPQNNPPVQPAGYAFAIWGPIYLWLIAGAFFGLFKRHDDPDWSPMRIPLAVSFGTGAIWLPVALLSPILATILIWVMLIFALFALFQAPEKDPFFARLPIGLYAGWLSAASCVAVGLILGGYGFLSLNITAWSMIGIAAIGATFIQIKIAAVPTYGLAVIWALIAVAVQNEFGLGGPALMALTGAGAVAFVMLRGLIQRAV
ncbi:MAG: hypothetical protein AAF729_12500 [Pseudomonadota bacterium]